MHVYVWLYINMFIYINMSISMDILKTHRCPLRAKTLHLSWYTAESRPLPYSSCSHTVEGMKFR